MAFDLNENDDCVKANNFYKKLFAQIPYFFFQLVVDSNFNYSLPFVSKSVREIFELNDEDFLKNTELMLHGRIFHLDKQRFFDSFLASKKELVTWEMEFRVVLPEKGLRWFKIMATPEKTAEDSVVFLGHVSDVSDLKEHELQLKISEERFKFALEASTAGIWDWNLVTNDVFYSSLSLKILELDSADVMDNPERWDKIVHPDDLNKYYADIHEHFDNKIPFYENYHRVMTSNGKYKWILDRGKVIERDSSGSPLRVIGTHTDVSAQKEKELELLKTMKLYSDQNSRLLNFSHIVSHNLLTQAGNIKSILDFIDADQKKENVDEMLLHLRTISNSLNDTISDLAQIVKTQTNINIIVKSLNLHEYISRTITAITGFENHENKFTVINNVPEYVFIDFNPAYLESVLLNFATNALKYAHPLRDPVIIFEFSIESDGHKALKIKDNGLGIDLTVYGDLLFGMYKTFHKHEDARGLGLYIIKNQLDAMKASVSVESEVGFGTTFKIIFDDL
nr:PAS domain-containing protein [uncultured Flavobacterium sp.]